MLTQSVPKCADNMDSVEGGKMRNEKFIATVLLPTFSRAAHLDRHSANLARFARSVFWDALLGSLFRSYVIIIVNGMEKYR